ncbi:MAG: hypothetical protein ABSE55_09690, partial [Terracidiphilus sp.]
AATENSKLAPARHQKNNRLPENLNRNTPLSRNRGRSHADTEALAYQSCPFKASTETGIPHIRVPQVSMEELGHIVLFVLNRDSPV